MDAPERTSPSNVERRRRERIIWRRSFALALVAHLAVFLLWHSDRPLLSPFAAAGPRAGDDRAAAGAMQSMRLSTPPSVPIVPPPVPLPTLDPIEPVEFDDELGLESLSLAGLDLGSLEGPGREDGTGAGDGGTADAGLYRMTPPNPRGMIIPPSSDKLKGREVEVWLFVDATGRVVPDSTVLRPPTSDRDYNRRLVREAAEWVFEPARQGGKAIAAWTSYRISM
jgi:hypothetical protein